VKQGWDTFGSSAFACTSGTAANDAELFKKEVLDPLLGEQQQQLAAKVRRLFNRAYALEQADTERALGGKPDEVFQLHPAEREDRRSRLATRITGFQLEGLSEPSNRLVDRSATMLQKNEVNYVEWENAPRELPRWSRCMLKKGCGTIPRLGSCPWPRGRMSARLAFLPTCCLTLVFVAAPSPWIWRGFAPTKL